tara:strand:- start:1291 stop:2379 length:1089 start_codon:yes stop_codon:yes gene_type:complete
MIHVIIGTRAQIIKMAPVMKELEERDIDYNFIFLAQHKETMYEILTQFGLKTPNIVIGDLNKDITNVKDMIFWSIRILIYGFLKRKKIFQNDKKGIVLIHGDAPPLFLGGLIAKFQGLKVAQVEAGLRSFNFLEPFPEEIIRVFSAKVGLIDMFFCQDEKAKMNVVPYKKMAYCTSYNTILDSLRLAEKISPKFLFLETSDKFALASLHRFETISKKEKLQQVVYELIKISKKIKVLFILHPPTRVALKKHNLYNLLEQESTCHLLPRLGFFKFNQMLRKAEFIITDGGSNQEECFYLGSPCLLFRNETERVEGLNSNAVLSKFNTAIIDDFVANYNIYKKSPILKDISPSSFIVDQLKEFI